MIRCAAFLYALSLFCTAIYAQTLKGKIETIKGKPLISASVVIKDSLSGNSKGYTMARNGIYFIHLKKDYENIAIVVSSYGYHRKTFEIKNPKKEKTYTLNFTLSAKSIEELKEVILSAKKLPFERKRDTLSYSVNAFKDGSERKIQEVIKKLPGVEVNEDSGEIKYKGKSVETVMLDGDDLFGRNYMIGTKNINVDIVERIEAIDNYTENPLLKGLEQGGKVALNLKLKEGKIDLSGNIDLGSGWLENKGMAFDLGTTILGIAKTYKSFGTLSYNNVGINRSPFDYFGFSFNTERIAEENHFAKKIIPETRFSNLLDDKRVNINKQLFGSYHSIFKLNKALSLKVNLYYIQDQITTDQFFENRYQVAGDNFITSDEISISKKPQQYRGDLKLKYHSSKSSLLEYTFRVRQENIETPTKIIQNQRSTFSSLLKTNDFYFKQKLLWTKKLTKKKALQVSLFYLFNQVPQKLTLTPYTTGKNIESNIQSSEFQKNFLEIKTVFLGTLKKDKYRLTLGSYLNKNPFDSELSDRQQTITQNKLNYIKKSIYHTGIYNFNIDALKISPSYNLSFLSQTLNQTLQNTRERFQRLIFTPALDLEYKFNRNSTLSASASYSQNTNAESYFFSNRVLLNNRIAIKNIPTLDMQQSQDYNLSFYTNNPAQRFTLQTYIAHQKSTGNFFSNTTISEKTTEIQYFFLPQDNSNWNLGVMASKYIPSFESTIKWVGSHSISNFRNVVNESELRQNQGQFSSQELFWKTAFDIPVNFEDSFFWRYSHTQSEGQPAFFNHAVQNRFKIIIRPNKEWFVFLVSDYYLPDLKKKAENFLFLDGIVRYRPKKINWYSSLIIRNITQEKNFEQISTSDISTSIFRSNLLPRHFILEVTWDF